MSDPESDAPTSGSPNIPLWPPRQPDDQSSNAHRQLIGLLGLMLPPLVYIVAGWRTTQSLPPWQLLSSISAYYYTGAVAAFVGILIALAVFLFTYRGYDNKYSRRDRAAAIIAGAAAVLAAFFPTSAPSDVLEPLWWTQDAGKIHHFSGVVLFGAFAFISLTLFPKSSIQGWKDLPTDKKLRNALFYLCGVGMIACLLWAVRQLWFQESVFWPEVGALEFVAVSWLVKGRTDWTAIAVGRRTLHYGRHPGQLLDKVQHAIRR